MTPRDGVIAIGLLCLLYFLIAYLLRPNGKPWDYSDDDRG